MQENQNSSPSESVSSEAPSPVPKSGGEKVSRKSQRKINRSSKSEVLASRRRTNPMVWLLLLVNTLVVAIICGAGFYGWMQWQSLQTAQIEREASFRQEVNTSVTQHLSNLTASTSADITALENKLSTQLATSGAKQDEMAQQIAGMQNAEATNWDQAELLYLVKMAQHKVIVENNIPAAINALLEVEEMLSGNSDIQYLPLRETVAADLQRLSAFDTDAQLRMLIAATALIQSSADLDFPKPNDFYNPDRPKVSDEASDWWRNLKINVRNLLMIDYDFELEESIKPFLTNQQKELIRASLQYHLLTVRHALIKQEKDLYEVSLSAASELVNQFVANQTREAFQQSIQQLMQNEFPLKPDIQLSSARYFLAQEAPTTVNPDSSNGQEL